MNGVNWTLVAKYLAGECSPQEERQVSTWVDEGAIDQRTLREARRIWRASEHCTFDERPSQEVVARDWERLELQLQQDEPDRPAHPRRNTSRRYGRRRPTRSCSARNASSRRLGVAVVCIVALIAGLFYASSEDLFLGGASDAVAADQFLREVATDRGERARLSLADGTTVILNADSRIQLPERFDGDQREVHLRGEAYFDVARDESRPFIVHTSDATIDVVGTAFNVRDYPDEGEISVAVAEGAVALRKTAHTPEEGSPIRPGELGRLKDGDDEVQREAANIEAYLAWTDGRLVFEDEPLSAVARRLERWYNIDCDIADTAIAARRLTASLTSYSLGDVLRVIATTLGVEYELEGGQVTFSKGNQT